MATMDRPSSEEPEAQVLPAPVGGAVPARALGDGFAAAAWRPGMAVTPVSVRALQAAAGNRAVARMLGERVRVARQARPAPAAVNGDRTAARSAAEVET